MITMSGPFKISSRLLASVEVGGCVLSFDPSNNHFYFDFSADAPGINGGKPVEHVEESWSPGGMRRKEAEYVQNAFESMASFIGACGEAYSYGMRNPGQESENLTLFPEFMREWCYQTADEWAMLECDLQENAYIQ